MTATQLDVRDLVFGTDGDSPADAIVQSLHDHDTVGTLVEGVRGVPDAAGRAIEHEVAGAIDGFLNLDLIDLAAGGWRHSTRLHEAARVTRDAPGRTEIVPMLTHRITSSHHPCVDVLVDGHRIGCLNVGLTVVFDIEGLLAMVREAQLVGAECGRCTAVGTLSVEDFVAAERQCRLDVPGMIQLRSGIPLLREDPRPAADPPAPSSARTQQLWGGAPGRGGS